jgi:hypothetical protein
MTRLPKILFAGLGLVLNLVAIAFLLGSSQLNRVIEFGVERALGHVCQTDVTVEEVLFAPTEERIQIKGLAIQNPLDFPPSEAMRVETLTVEYDTQSIWSSGAPVVRRIALEGTKVAVLLKNKKGTNLGALAKTALEAGGEDDWGAPSGVTREFVVQRVECDGVGVTFSTNLLPKARADLKVKGFEIDEVGEREGVVTAGMLTAEIMRAILNSSTSVRGLNKPATRILFGELQQLPT